MFFPSYIKFGYMTNICSLVWNKKKNHNKLTRAAYWLSPWGMKTCFCSLSHSKQCDSKHHTCLIMKDNSGWYTEKWSCGSFDKVIGSQIKETSLVDGFSVGVTVRAQCNVVRGGFHCRSLFVVERITVSDLVANKISGSGSCLIGKLQNSPHNCERSCCLACSQQEGNHKIHT